MVVGGCQYWGLDFSHSEFRILKIIQVMMSNRLGKGRLDMGSLSSIVFLELPARQPYYRWINMTQLSSFWRCMCVMFASVYGRSLFVHASIFSQKFFFRQQVREERMVLSTGKKEDLVKGTARKQELSENCSENGDPALNGELQHLIDFDENFWWKPFSWFRPILPRWFSFNIVKFVKRSYLCSPCCSVEV